LYSLSGSNYLEITLLKFDYPVLYEETEKNHNELIPSYFDKGIKYKTQSYSECF